MANYNSPWTKDNDPTDLFSDFEIVGATDLNTDSGVLYVEYTATETITDYTTPWSEVGDIPHLSNWNLSDFVSFHYDANGKIYLEITDAGDGDLIIRGYSAVSGGIQSINNLINGAGSQSISPWGTVDFDGVVFNIYPRNSSQYLQGTPIGSIYITISLYKDVAKTELVAQGTGDSLGEIVLSAQNDSGLSATCIAAVLGENSEGTLTGTTDEDAIIIRLGGSIKLINPNRVTRKGSAIAYVNLSGTYALVEGNEYSPLSTSGVTNNRFLNVDYYGG